MTSISATPSQPATPVATDPRAGTGIQGAIGNLIRGSVAGYAQATRTTAVQADKAAIHPFEAVTTATGLLKSSTANIKGVSKATSLVHTIGGFALLIMNANTSSMLRAPGETAVDIGNRVADMIDGKDTAKGWNLGWGVDTEGADAPSAFDALGMR